MNKIFDRISITIDKKTKEKIDGYGENHSLSRSAVIRLITSEFFIKKEGKL
jgi:metal-responsive CopG/Arc/MetJ family transcriptional regulator